MSLNVQYGSGFSSPADWINFDASPTLKLQRIPLFGKLVKREKFPDTIRFGDITKKLPGISPGSCDFIFCSHVLEHLSLQDFKIALKNTFNLLKEGGVFRCILPDLEFFINQYVDSVKLKDPNASTIFMKSASLGLIEKPKSLRNKLISLLGNSNHLWMWDQYSLYNELINIGFTKVRKCNFNDSEYPVFNSIENPDRYWAAIAFECVK